MFPWSTITLLTKKPPILHVTTKASSCGWDVPSKSVSLKVIEAIALLNFFSSWPSLFTLGEDIALKTALQLMPCEAAWIASIIPNGRGRVQTFRCLTPGPHSLLLDRPKTSWGALLLLVVLSDPSRHDTIWWCGLSPYDKYNINFGSSSPGHCSSYRATKNKAHS